jgi:hypothetical protein
MALFGSTANGQSGNNNGNGGDGVNIVASAVGKELLLFAEQETRVLVVCNL